MDKGKKLDGNNLLLYIIGLLLKITDSQLPKNKYESKDLIKEFDFNFFDDNNCFYANLISQLSYNNLAKILDNIEVIPDYILRYIIIFIKYIESIINSNQYKELYKDTIVKIDFSILIGYLYNKYGEKIIESIEFFPLCIKELEKKYNISCNVTNTDNDYKIKKEASNKIINLFNKKGLKFRASLESLKTIYIEKNKYEEYEQIIKIIEKYDNDDNINMNNLDVNYINNKEYKKHLDTYLEKELINYGYIKNNFKDNYEIYEDKKKQLKKNIFYSDILKIDLNNSDICSYYLYFKSNIYKDEPFFDIDQEFKELLKRKDIKGEIDCTEYLKKIIEKESFIEEFKTILNSDSVKTYFEKNRSFKEGKYDFSVIFTDDEINNDVKKEDDYLRDDFINLKKKLDEDKDFLSKIIIFKYLPKYIRAFVNPNMRIIINPIFFEFSESLDDNKKNNIFKSYLFIIIINEMMYLLKFMKKEKNLFDKIPKTPENKEGEQMFINYLFNLPVIYYITDEQASKINKIENWKNNEILSSIFKEQKEWYEKKKNKEIENCKRPGCSKNDYIICYLSFYEEDTNDNMDKEDIKDPWYDIN